MNGTEVHCKNYRPAHSKAEYVGVKGQGIATEARMTAAALSQQSFSPKELELLANIAGR